MKLCNNYEIMSENIVQRGIDYLEKYPNIKTMVIGLSGGIDSTLTATIAREICNRTCKHKLLGFSIPIESNKKSEVDIAEHAGKTFCHEFTEVKWIDRAYPLFKRIFFKRLNGENVRFGNIKARFRMIYLYDKAHRHDGIVLSTDNLTEFNLGFWTLHGDVGDLGFIQQLWKTEVYGMAHYLCARYAKIVVDPKVIHWEKYAFGKAALSKAIYATPTDGLGITNSDFDQIGVSSYEEVDKLLLEYIKSGSKDKLLEKHPVIQRHLKYSFKHVNPYNIPRESIIPKPKPVILDLI